MRGFRVPIVQMETILALLGKHIEKVIEEYAHGEMTLISVKRLLHAGTFQLWLAMDEGQIKGWGITEVVQYPELRRIRFVFLGGIDFDEWSRELTPTIEEWAKSFGATEIEAWTRPGFYKKLSKQGFKKAYDVLLRTIE